jgi:hypothetical protein
VRAFLCLLLLSYTQVYNEAVQRCTLTNEDLIMEIVTKKEFFQWQAPSFNFELDADQLLAEALKRGFLTKVDGEGDQYLVNDEYGEA